ncbi:Aerobic cobaltochelatase cobT subunit (cobalamin biosynthesis) [Magnetospirillum gryphiswaldense MSR-1 v2]|uniref:Cobaltochelatase subunit CobT n=1 Tax=Magnetospirillum gryphiswaldense (strain DSM 6361 / JCM 21280 / NBRC 15271 / MSR-1) TaxID=431944 RepID=V6F772_MAGGM|nr:cobaltochelatase subunit CobT [Magnetospirillum gryphiswaldense]CDL01289.1 Aerobic cobaltochelatase cobT subunit (cobalamin biosynthesis) [Magnetospirillum gryphiswaldense MSR-1 v2]
MPERNSANPSSSAPTRDESPTDTMKRATAMALRAIAGRADLDVGFVAGAATVRGLEIKLPSPQKNLTAGDLVRLRGTADAVALRFRYHNDSVHARRMPPDPQARKVYEAVEQARIEALGARRMAGVAENIAGVLEQRCRAEGIDRITKRDDMPLSEAMRFIAREHFTGLEPPAAAERAVNLWRPYIEEKIGHSLDGLRDLIANEDAFAGGLKDLLVQLDIFDESELESEEKQSDEEGQEAREGQSEGQKDKDGDSQSQGQQGEGEPKAAPSAAEGSGEQDGLESASEEVLMTGAGTEEAGGPSRQRQTFTPQAGANGEKPYHPYTTKYDQVITAEELCEPEEMTRLRNQLDQQMSHLQGVVSKLANRLQRKLMAQQTRSWNFDLEEGILDTGRLARIVANPTHSLSFKHEKETDFRDTVVTLLIDNSGSMRGRPITVAALSAEILARTLERCAVKVEVLGFTTKAWKGGQAREQWQADGKPQQPGRLNDLRHIVYKAADAPWRRARKNLGLMLREGILKENIDGEALLWAHDRLIARSEQRRILMVISDGAPVDDSTLSVNSGNYLEKHLRDVIDYVETKSPVELIAIGIGHDVTRYYRRAVTIMDAEELGGAVMRQLTALFDEEGVTGAIRPGLR